MTTIINMAHVWKRRTLPAPIEARITEVLESWKDTPYMSGQSMRGTGVDCLRFCTGVLDDLYGYRRIEIPRLPPDTAFHDPERASELFRWVIGNYAPNHLVEDGSIEPGDFLASYPRGAGHSHGMLFGADGRLWHANGRPGRRGGVKGVGLALMARAQARFEIWRLEDKHLWAL